MLKVAAADSSLARRHGYIAIPANPHLDDPVAPLRAALGVALISKPFDLDKMLASIAQAEARLRG